MNAIEIYTRHANQLLVFDYWCDWYDAENTSKFGIGIGK